MVFFSSIHKTLDMFFDALFSDTRMDFLRREQIYFF